MYGRLHFMFLSKELIDGLIYLQETIKKDKKKWYMV